MSEGIREEEIKRESLSHNHDVTLFTTYTLRVSCAHSRDAQPCWIPFAAVDQNYKAERPLEIPLNAPSSEFSPPLSFFRRSRRKREQGRSENAAEIDSFVCFLSFSTKREREPS